MLGAGIEAGGQHARAVQNEHVARFQIVRNIAEDAVLDALIFAVIDEETGRIARLCGRLRDELLGKIVIKIAGFQCFRHDHDLTFLFASVPVGQNAQGQLLFLALFRIFGGVTPMCS